MNIKERTASAEHHEARAKALGEQAETQTGPARANTVVLAEHHARCAKEHREALAALATPAQPAAVRSAAWFQKTYGFVNWQTGDVIRERDELLAALQAIDRAGWLAHIEALPSESDRLAAQMARNAIARVLAP